MKRRFLLLVALVTLLCLVLCGCGGLVSYEQMNYSRPDMTNHQRVLEASCTVALESDNVKKVVDAIWNYYDEYDHFYTNYNLAMISHFRDLTDIYWDNEFAYCAEHSTEVDAGLDRLYRCLAQSPVRETLEGEDYFGAGYFDSFEGESIYDETLTDFLSQEAVLLSQYQSLWNQPDSSKMEEVFLNLVKLRNELAAYAGYDSYPQFAYDFYYGRDYTVEQATSYLADIRAELAPLYSKLEDAVFEPVNTPASQQEVFAYVESMAKKMGGSVKSAFSSMKKAGVYDLTYSENKYATSFEVYLRNYQTPYIFLSPMGVSYDKLTFAHEFGHFCTDYVMPGGSYQGVDVAEFFSQGMEYLSLFYADGGAELEQARLALCLSDFVEQAAYASFEHQVYDLPEAELTVEGIEKLYRTVGSSFGFDETLWCGDDFVYVPHFYEQPMYIISYVLSSDAALQIYELERQEQGSGLACYTANLTSQQPQLLDFLAEAGLKSPFEAQRLQQMKQTMLSVIG